mgnify:FL=1
MAIKKVFVVSAETKKAQKEIENLTEQLEIQDKVINDLNNDLARQQKMLENTSKSNLAARKKINNEIKKTKTELAGEKRARVDLNNQRKKANKDVKDSIKNQKDLTGVLGFVDKATGGALSGMQNFVSSITSATRGMKLLRVAFIATGIGAFVVAVASLGAAFTQSEEGQEKLQRGLAVLGAITKQIMDSFADLGEAIIDAVSNPMESIKSLGKGLLKFVINPFKTVKDAVIGAKDSVKEFVDETVKEVKVIDQVTKARQKAHHIERDLLVERAEANRKINDIRLQAEDRVNNTATERIALLREAQRLEEEITAKEIAAKQLLVTAQELEMAQGKNSIEDKDKLAKLQAELINLDTKKLRSQRLLQTQITTALNEEQAIKDKKIADDKTKTDKAEADEKTRLERIKAIRDAHEQKVKEEEAIKEEEKAIIEKEKALAELEKLNASEEEKANIIAYWNGKIKEGKDIDAENEEKRDAIVQNAKLRMATKTFSNIAAILGENSKAGKAAAVAAALINTYQGITTELATKTATPFEFALKLSNIAATASIGFKSVKNILATDPKKASAPSGSSVSRAATPQAQSPSFNIVGQGGTSQIASAIGEQQQQPIQAFVVSQDVTTAQSLENNIIQGATIGG